MYGSQKTFYVATVFCLCFHCDDSSATMRRILVNSAEQESPGLLLRENRNPAVLSLGNGQSNVLTSVFNAATAVVDYVKRHKRTVAAVGGLTLLLSGLFIATRRQFSVENSSADQEIHDAIFTLLSKRSALLRTEKKSHFSYSVAFGRTKTEVANMDSNERYHYAMCLLREKGRSEQALFQLQWAALKSDLAQHQLAVFLLYGLWIEQDLPTAALFFRVAAEQGNTEAQYEYATCLRDGTGCKQDLTKAAEYFKLAADNGHDLAQYEYALCFCHGTGVERNLTTAAEYFKLAEDNGHDPAPREYKAFLRDGMWVSCATQSDYEAYLRDVG